MKFALGNYIDIQHFLSWKYLECHVKENKKKKAKKSSSFICIILLIWTILKTKFNN